MKDTSANKKISYRDLGLSLSDYQEITVDNVLYLGECVAVNALRTYMIYSNRDLYKLYKGLIYNISTTLRINKHYTDGYDLAQEATCFLCEYIGHKLGDEYITKTGSKISIVRAALRHIERQLERKMVLSTTNCISKNVDNSQYIYPNNSLPIISYTTR